MLDKFRLRKDVERGSRAKKLLEDPLVQEAFEKIEQECILAWQTSKAGDDEERHNAYLMQRLLRRLNSVFRETVVKGEVSRKELFKKSKDKNPIRVV